MRQAERKLAEQAELAYRNTVRDWQATQTKRQTMEVGASATKGAHQTSPQRAKPRGRPQAPDVCASASSFASGSRLAAGD
jgi:hypothetical protein